MNIIDHGRAFRDGLRALAGRSTWDWRQCPRCEQTDTWPHGHYTRHPWTVTERHTMPAQRYWCLRCRSSYSEQSALLVRG